MALRHTTRMIHPFDDAFRREVTARLGSFEVRRADPAHGLKRAAVALTLVDDGAGHAAFVLTKRQPKLNSHGGQLALPGGRVDAGETVEQAALRELEEEVGLRAGSADVVGVLDDYPTRSGYLMSPVVIWAPTGAALVANPSEVAHIYRIPMTELRRADSPHIFRIPESDRPVIRLPFFDNTLNAPTAAVVYQFREVALEGRPTRVDHFDQPVWAWR
jgi:8-oxo-dGTP pyrophosphatase MutT (NUDIX family)